MTTPMRDQTLIGSVQRALSLVDIVANSNRPVPVKALATAAQLTSGTAYNLVRTLIHEGYLAAEPDGVVLGPRFPGFSDERTQRGVFLAQVRDALNTATDQTGVTAYLSRYSDGEINLVDIVDARSSPRVELWVGMHDSAHATALGKLILAQLSPDERLDYLTRHPLSSLTQHTLSDRRTLLTQISQHSGWMIDREEYAIGHTCVAVPVSAPGVTASLAVSLPTGHLAPGSIDVPEITRTLQSIAGRLSLRLGTERFGQLPLQ